MRKKEKIMNPEDIDKIFNEVKETLIAKNQDYGGASFDLGLVGNMVHIHDKENRYRNLVEKQRQGLGANFESIEDTLKDLIGYCVIGLLILNDEQL